MFTGALPLVDLIVIGAGGSFTTPGGGTLTRFRDYRDYCVSGRSTGLALPVLGT